MHVHVISDTALNDSNKTISIPNGPWEVASIRVEYTATATAGNRTLEVRVLDGDSDIISGTRLTTNITASDVMVRPTTRLSARCTSRRSFRPGRRSKSSTRLRSLRRPTT
jgi:hypothetical protein